MGKTHSCKYFRLQADEYIEGELTDAEMREFEAHIAECEECRREVESIRALNAILRSNREKMPDGLHARIMDAVRSESASKPRRKVAFFRSAAISAACIALGLCITAILGMMPFWQGNGGGSLPEDPLFASTDEAAENVETMSSSIHTKPEPEIEQTEAPEDIAQIPEITAGSGTIIPETTASIEAEGTFTVAESAAPPAGDITEAEQMTAEAESLAQPSSSASPETDVLPSTEAETTYQFNFKGDSVDHPTYDATPEASSAPGGEEITLALLVVSGLLAVASFIAFLISLSSIRNKPINKGDQK